MRIILQPVDTWFFRDSTPFDMATSPQAGLKSIFPPSPFTITGAIRVALARAKGWNGRGRWGAEFTKVLGDGVEDIGPLQIKGPFLIKTRGGKPTLLFPVPQHLLGMVKLVSQHQCRIGKEEKWVPADYITPGANLTECDLGLVNLPQWPKRSHDGGDNLEQGGKYWLTLAGLHQVLQAKLPNEDQIIAEDKLWSVEPRIGITRDNITRATVEGALYSTQHIRVNLDIALGVEIAGVPDEWPSPIRSLVPLGGESRLAVCEKWPCQNNSDHPVDAGHNWQSRVDAWIKQSATIALIALTPVLIDRQVLLGRQPLEREGLTVFCACCDRPRRIGGWDSLERRPLPVKNALAPGSVLFCRVNHPDNLLKAIYDNKFLNIGALLSIGASINFGFGLCVLAKVPMRREN